MLKWRIYLNTNYRGEMRWVRSYEVVGGCAPEVSVEMVFNKETVDIPFLSSLSTMAALYCI